MLRLSVSLDFSMFFYFYNFYQMCFLVNFFLVTIGITDIHFFVTKILQFNNNNITFYYYLNIPIFSISTNLVFSTLSLAQNQK